MDSWSGRDRLQNQPLKTEDAKQHVGPPDGIFEYQNNQVGTVDDVLSIKYHIKAKLV